MKPAQTARAPWDDIVTVCSKCARKAGNKRFRKDLKDALQAAGAGKRIRVVESSCLDLCPKHRVTLATGRGLAEGRLIVVAPGNAESAARAVLAATQPQPSI